MTATGPADGAVTLGGFQKAGDNVPSLSGFCQKAETYLRVAGIPYSMLAIYPHKSPTGRLPFITISKGGTTSTIPDSHNIIRHLIKDGLGKDLNAGLTPIQAAESRAWQQYIETQLYLCVVYERWVIDKNFAILSEEISAGTPWPLSWALPRFFRPRVCSSLKGHGVGRRGEEEVKELISQAIQDLETRLPDHGATPPYLFSTKEPTEIDVIIAGFMMNMLGQGANPHASSRILQSPKLMALTRSMVESFFPEYKSVLELLGVKSSDEGGEREASKTS